MQFSLDGTIEKANIYNGSPKNGQTGAVCRFKRRLGKTRGGWCFKMPKLSNSATHHSGQHFLKKYLRVDINFKFRL